MEDNLEKPPLQIRNNGIKLVQTGWTIKDTAGRQRNKITDAKYYYLAWPDLSGVYFISVSK